MTDKAGTPIRFRFASPFRQSSENASHMLPRFCDRPRRTRLQFPFCPYTPFGYCNSPVKISALPAQTPQTTYCTVCKSPVSVLAYPSLRCLQIPHLSSCGFPNRATPRPKLAYRLAPWTPAKSPESAICRAPWTPS